MSGAPDGAWQRAARQFVHVRPAPGAHRAALRAGVSVGVPLLLVVALGRPHLSAYAAFGAFTSLYGRNHVGLPRVTMQAQRGRGAACLARGRRPGGCDGVALARRRRGDRAGAGGQRARLGAGLAPARTAVPGVRVRRDEPVPHATSDVGVAALVATASAAFALVVGNAGAVLRRDLAAFRRAGPRERPRQVAWGDVLLYGTAVLLAGAAATLTGLGHPYWASVAAVAPLMGLGATNRLVRAAHRVVGTLLGLLTSALLLAPHPSPVAAVLVVAVLQVAAEPAHRAQLRPGAARDHPHGAAAGPGGGAAPGRRACCSNEACRRCSAPWSQPWWCWWPGGCGRPGDAARRGRAPTTRGRPAGRRTARAPPDRTAWRRARRRARAGRTR
nr:FUSC family protein [Angustibacter aerolatus]